MAALSPRSRWRLAEIGVDVWVRRDRAPEPDSAAGTGPRIRLASGSGDWLLVQASAWDGRHDKLLGDIQATIGSARCRFGQWSDSASAGVAVDELESRGIARMLSFGPPPERVAEAALVVAPTLEELARDGAARRRLWSLLREALE
jgi:hypothetical protein